MKNGYSNLILLISFLILFSCKKASNVNPNLHSFQQKKLDSYIDDLGIRGKYKIHEKRKLKNGMWFIEVFQNQEGGLCEKNYTGDVLIKDDSIFLLADYIYNEPRYEDVWFESPVNNCGSSFRFILKGIKDLNNYKIIFENELSGDPVSSHFLEDYYKKFPNEKNNESIEKME